MLWGVQILYYCLHCTVTLIEQAHVSVVRTNCYTQCLSHRSERLLLKAVINRGRSRGRGGARLPPKKVAKKGEEKVAVLKKVKNRKEKGTKQK